MDLKITIVDDRLWMSVGRDVFTYASLCLAFLTGWLYQSSAMQWCALVILLLFAGGIAVRPNLMTAQQAADHLRDKYGVTASDR